MSSDSRVFVGNLPRDIQTKEVKDLFRKYGPIEAIEVKHRKRDDGSDHYFAFVHFDDRRDAEDAVRSRDGIKFDGCYLRVEFCHGSRRGQVSRRDIRSPVRSSYRVRVSGIPETGSWQDVKDHMRMIGDVCYAEVDKFKGTGIVEYLKYNDMERALRKMDYSKITTHRGDTGVIRVTEYDEDRRSPRGRSRTQSRSPRKQSRSRSRRSSPF